MVSNTPHNFLFAFLIESKYRSGRHMLFIIAFSFIVVGQSLFTFKDQIYALGTRAYWVGAVNILVILALAYFNLYFLTPRFLLKNKFIEYFIILIVGAALYLLLRDIITYYSLLNLGIEQNINGITLLDLFSNTALYAVCMASSSVSVLIKQWLSDSDRINALENTQLKNSVNQIKNQINPKSLSNVLDKVVEQAEINPKAASDILFRLSDVLRYELYDCKREKVLLESDINFIDQYLSLEQLSSPSRFTYTINVTGKTGLFIAPFVFIPVILQILEQLPASINIHFNMDKDIVKFRCEASGADLVECDFSDREQQMSILYKKEIRISKSTESVEMQVKLC